MCSQASAVIGGGEMPAAKQTLHTGLMTAPGWGNFQPVRIAAKLFAAGTGAYEGSAAADCARGTAGT